MKSAIPIAIITDNKQTNNQSDKLCELKQELLRLKHDNETKSKTIQSLHNQLKLEQNKTVSQQHQIKRINNAFEDAMNKLRAAGEFVTTGMNIIDKTQKENDRLQIEIKEYKLLLNELLRKHNRTKPNLTNFGSFDLLNKDKWQYVDKYIFKGINTDPDPDKMWFIYSNCNHINGYNTEIHEWSIKCTNNGNNSDCKINTNIGIISEKNESIVLNSFDINKWSSYCNGIEYNWKMNEIITVLLDCDTWNVRYYKNGKQIHFQKIKPNTFYYFGLASPASKQLNIMYESVNTYDLVLNQLKD